MLLLLLIAGVLGAALTGLYFVHESLPRAIRAPTSLVLAPVAVVDGLCHATGRPGIYGRIVPILAVNWTFGLVMYGGVVGVSRWWLRVRAYAFLLVTDRYPPFSLGSD